MFAALEAEFNAIVNDGRSVGEKLEALVGLHTKSAELEALATPLATVIEDASKATSAKVTEILTMVGKL